MIRGGHVDVAILGVSYMRPYHQSLIHLYDILGHGSVKSR